MDFFVFFFFVFHVLYLWVSNGDSDFAVVVKERPVECNEAWYLRKMIMGEEKRCGDMDFVKLYGEETIANASGIG